MPLSSMPEEALQAGPQALLALAERLLRDDAQARAAWCAAGMEESEAGWTFSLPQLHRHLHGEGLSYRVWLRQLYRSDVNARLRRLGGVFVVLESRGKVALNRYRLQRLPD